MVQVVERADVVEHLAAGGRRAASGIGEVEHRLLAAAELDALVAGRQEAAAPEAVIQRLVGPAPREQHDECRQVLVEATETVGDPRAHAGPARELRAGLHERDRRVVVDRLGLHRADERDVVRDLRGMRQELAEPCAALAVLPELEDRWGNRETLLPGGHRGDPLAHPHRVGQLDPAALAEGRLVIEQVHLRRRARLEQVDHPLRPRGEVRQPGESDRRTGPRPVVPRHSRAASPAPASPGRPPPATGTAGD